MSFDPDGPLFIPINTQTTITCSYPEGIVNKWSVILRNSTVFGASGLQPTIKKYGITGIFMSPLLQLVVNTPNMSVVGLRCEGVVLDGMGNVIRRSEADISLTIYGKCLILC